MPSGFFALFDDIAVLMDDVAAMSKIATRKTAGILADDLAVNAEKASGFVSSRELPILWKIAKGSFLSKLIILPIAFLLSAYLPWVIVPILLLIVIIALGSVSDQPLQTQIPVVTIVAILATIGVYGLVALLVRMDDLGYRLIARSDDDAGFSKTVGNGLVKTLPIIIRVLGVLGTIAMILVAGGIFVHNLPFFHDLFQSIPSIIVELVVGLIVGIVALAIVKLFSKVSGVKQ
jgi:predicted DNA repair protein MutK